MLCLDYKRHGKQRVESRQILDILKNPEKLIRGKKNRWRNHPAVLMWKGYENALTYYSNVAIFLWILKGYINNMKFESVSFPIKYPHWFGNDQFHDSHKSNLLRKNFIYYSQYDWNVKTDLPYYWPKSINE